MMIAWFVWFMPQTPPQTSANTPSANAVTAQQTTAQAQIAALDDSTRKAQAATNYADLAPLTVGTAQTVTVKTDLLTINLDSKGGTLKSAYLNEHKSFDGKPLAVYAENEKNKFAFDFAYQGRAIHSSELYFVPSATSLTVAGNGVQTLTMRAALSGNRAIEQVYTFQNGKYDIGYQVHFVGMENDLKNAFIELSWLSYLPRTEKAVDNMRQKSTISYKTSEDNDYLKAADKEFQTESLNAVEWISYKSQFFTHALIPAKPFGSAKIDMIYPTNDFTNKVMSSKMAVAITRGNDIKADFRMYMGPLRYTVLNKYDVGLEKQMDLGWTPLNYINIGTTYVFTFLEKTIGNYGLIILIFALIVRVVVLPMTYKSHVSMTKLRVLNEMPEVKALDEKHKDDPQRLQVEKMNIYRQMGVSPLGGCIPMLAMYPILISMFYFFPQAIELRQQSFLWATDLSSYDSIMELPFTIPFYGSHVSLFTLLMTASTIAYVYFSQGTQPTVNAQMKYISYFMPIMFLFFLNNYAAGLSLYYFASNLLSIAQTQLIRLTIDDKKLLEQMHEAKKNKANKGDGSKSRMERWMETQQQKQKEMQNARRQQGGGNAGGGNRNTNAGGNTGGGNRSSKRGK